MPFSRRTFIAAALLWQAGRAQAQSPNDARVKARLALSLARFTQWPATSFAAATDPLWLCSLHLNELMAEAFAELGGQTAASRLVKVSNNPEKVPAVCHVLFVHESAGSAITAALAAVAASPVLTIGDSEGFAARGGMVELVNVNDAIRLDVNLKALRAAQLGLSSQVLKLARQVRE